MIAVILEFEPINGMEEEFVSAWAECTEAIYENLGSLGSRLHRSTTGNFIAYAQWPDRETYERSSQWPEGLVAVRDKMRALLKEGAPRVLHVLNVEVDLLKINGYSEMPNNPKE